MPSYRNRNTGVTVTYPKASARLEALPQWESVDDPEDDTTVSDATGRAEAERASIQEAARHRASFAERYHEEALGIQRATVEARETTTEPNVTMAHLTPPGWTASDGVLARAKADHESGALQIGDPDPEAHPRTREGLEAKAARDSARIAAAAPEEEGVLTRAREGMPTNTYTAGASNAEVELDEDSAEVANTGNGDMTSTNEPTGEQAGEQVAQPKRNASLDAWQTYAVSQGATEDDVDGLSRDELIEKYGQ